jgi:anhydro-N-acetylmuramic acid kinase
MDGVDASLVEFTPKGQTHLASHTHPWPQQLQQQLRALAHPGDNEIERLGVLDKMVADEFALCVQGLLQKAKRKPNEICAIGSHG